MASAITIKRNISKLEAALKSKATPKTLKSKLEAQLVKSKAELSALSNGTKPKTSTTKSTQSTLQKLKEMVNKNKKYSTYKGSGVDLEKDADRPALRIGKRTAKKSGKTYYEYRANRIDVKQPPKKYPKLEDGGMMAHGGMTEHEVVESNAEMIINKIKEVKHHAKELSELVSKDSEIEAWVVAKIERASTDLSDITHYLDGRDDEEMQEDKYEGYMKHGGYMAKGGLVEHGLERGDLIELENLTDDGDIEVKNKFNSKNYSVNLNNGTREEIVRKLPPYMMADGGETEELYKVVGKKNGQLVDISELPMSKDDANKFIKKQGVEKYYTNVDVIRYRGNKPRHMMAHGGEIHRNEQ